jgi:glycosyltransferase involved in cell wall biosynthesis
LELPSISILIPTYNSSRSLKECLDSIKSQDYPADRVEIIIIDAGSTDDTLEIASQAGVGNILPNPLKTGEAGKAVGLDAATGEIVAFIDSDNILDGDDWLRKMVSPFENPDIALSESYAFTYRPTDSIVDRYCSLLGMNDPVHLFIGNYDRLSALTGKFTGLPLQMTDRGDYYEVILTKDTLPTMGANGSCIRRSAVLQTNYRPYYFDIDVVYELVCAGYNRIAMVKKGIIHIYCPDLRTFARKQKRRISDYLYHSGRGERAYPHKRFFWGYVMFVICCLLMFPLVAQSILGYARKKDSAWFIHPLTCWLTLVIYAWVTVLSLFRTAAYDRTNWSQ